MGKILLILFTVPLLETWLLIKLGGIIGALPTIASVIFTAMVGGALVRNQGMATWMRAQQELQQGKTPATEMMEGMAIMFAGALLITPGFFTDAVGFLLLLPAFRRGLITRFIAKHIVMAMSGGRGPGGNPNRSQNAYGANSDSIDGEFTRVDSDSIDHHDNQK